MYKGQYDGNASYVFFSETVHTVTMKFTCIKGISVRKLRLFLHKISFIINTIFPPLHARLYAGYIKLFAAVSRQLFTHIVFEHLIQQNSTYLD
jgi:hypothetical protein